MRLLWQRPSRHRSIWESDGYAVPLLRPTLWRLCLNYPTPGPVPPGGDYPGYRPRPQRRTTWLWISLAIAVAIIMVLSAVVITQLTGKKSDTSTPAAPPQSSTVQSGQPSSTQQRPSGAARPTMTCEGYTAQL